MSDLPIVREIGRGNCSIDAYVEAHILRSKTCGDTGRTVALPSPLPGRPLRGSLEQVEVAHDDRL